MKLKWRLLACGYAFLFRGTMIEVLFSFKVCVSLNVCIPEFAEDLSSLGFILTCLILFKLSSIRGPLDCFHPAKINLVFLLVLVVNTE